VSEEPRASRSDEHGPPHPNPLLKEEREEFALLNEEGNNSLSLERERVRVRVTV
jgi:hypothetical protein